MVTLARYVKSFHMFVIFVISKLTSNSASAHRHFPVFKGKLATSRHPAIPSPRHPVTPPPTNLAFYKVVTLARDQWTCNGLTMDLQWTYNELTMDLQWTYNGLTMNLQWTYNELTMDLQ